jgi:hypothetical protein
MHCVGANIGRDDLGGHFDQFSPGGHFLPAAFQKSNVVGLRGGMKEIKYADGRIEKKRPVAAVSL